MVGTSLRKSSGGRFNFSCRHHGSERKPPPLPLGPSASAALATVVTSDLSLGPREKRLERMRRGRSKQLKSAQGNKKKNKEPDPLRVRRRASERVVTRPRELSSLEESCSCRHPRGGLRRERQPASRRRDDVGVSLFVSLPRLFLSPPFFFPFFFFTCVFCVRRTFARLIWFPPAALSPKRRGRLLRFGSGEAGLARREVKKRGELNGGGETPPIRREATAFIQREAGGSL